MMCGRSPMYLPALTVWQMRSVFTSNTNSRLFIPCTSRPSGWQVKHIKPASNDSPTSQESPQMLHRLHSISTSAAKANWQSGQRFPFRGGRRQPQANRANDSFHDGSRYVDRTARLKRRLENGPSYISAELDEWLDERNMGHVRDAPCHP